MKHLFNVHKHKILCDLFYQLLQLQMSVDILSRARMGNYNQNPIDFQNEKFPRLVFVGKS